MYEKIHKGKHVANFETVEYAVELSSRHSSHAKNVMSSTVSENLDELFERSRESQKSQHKELRNILVKFQDVFSRGKGDLGRVGITKHRIDVGDAKPIRQPTKVLPVAEGQEADRAVDEMKM